jgi:hypothetical protein
MTVAEGNILDSLQFETWSRLTIRKSSFPSSDSKAKGVLDIVHSDTCGPMTTTSHSRYEHYVSFIDDFSHKNWIYFLKTKKRSIQQVQGIQSPCRKYL